MLNISFLGLGEGWKLVTKVTRTARRYKAMGPNTRFYKLARLLYSGTPTYFTASLL